MSQLPHLVRHIGDTDIEKRKIGLEDIAHDQVKFVLERRAHDTLLQLGCKPRVHLAGDHLGMFNIV